MTTYSFPLIRPSMCGWGYVSNTGIHEGPFSDDIETIDRDGEHWILRMSWDDIEGDRKAELLSFLYKLNGAQHRFTVQDFGYVKRGTATGQAVVNGAGQTGKSLSISSLNGTLKAGDQISVNNRLYVLDSDVASGSPTLSVSPRIFTAHANASEVKVSTPVQSFALMTQIIEAPTTAPTKSAVSIQAKSAY